MRKLSRGFGLIEIMVALTLGLVITLGLIQLFISAKNSYVSQSASAAMQEDARFVLSKMIQEIRMVGMFGCLATMENASDVGSFLPSRDAAISWNNTRQTLTLIAADVSVSGGSPDWIVLSDCESSATAYAGKTAPNPAIGQMTFPISKVVYTYNRRNSEITGLIKNVSAFTVLFGVASSAADLAISHYTANPSDSALIRSVRLSMTLTDPTDSVKAQTFSAVAALRNRLG